MVQRHPEGGFYNSTTGTHVPLPNTLGSFISENLPVSYGLMATKYLWPIESDKWSIWGFLLPFHSETTSFSTIWKFGCLPWDTLSRNNHIFTTIAGYQSHSFPPFYQIHEISIIITWLSIWRNVHVAMITCSNDYSDFMQINK